LENLIYSHKTSVETIPHFLLQHSKMNIFGTYTECIGKVVFEEKGKIYS